MCLLQSHDAVVLVLFSHPTPVGSTHPYAYHHVRAGLPKLAKNPAWYCECVCSGEQTSLALVQICEMRSVNETTCWFSHVTQTCYEVPVCKQESYWVVWNFRMWLLQSHVVLVLFSAPTPVSSSYLCTYCHARTWIWWLLWLIGHGAVFAQACTIWNKKVGPCMQLMIKWKPDFLHSCKITSGSGLGTRLVAVTD